ncbi:MAG: arylformamidase [Saprospiraceae bacterium]|jgi:kynurenine formamidase
MKILLVHNDNSYAADLSDGIDISIPLIPGSDSPNFFWAPHFTAEPVRAGDWVGDTLQGGDVNFKTVTLNPHGNGTHTECVGHIAKEPITINQVLTNFHHIAQVISIYPQVMANGDKVITKSQIQDSLNQSGIKALIIRTMPNNDDKKRRIYSGTNPPYMHHEAISYIVERGIEHLLLDLPSVDREKDEGLLLGHKAFWSYPSTIDKKKTISEMIYVNNSAPDGLYLLNIQIASFELDASPSKPVIYKLIEK